jgi:hypothetical protein
MYSISKNILFSVPQVSLLFIDTSIQVHPFSSRSESVGGCGGWDVFALYIDHLGDDLASVSCHSIYILATPALSPSPSQVSFASLLRSWARIVALLMSRKSQYSITMGHRSPVTFSTGIMSCLFGRLQYCASLKESQPTPCFLANFTSSLIPQVYQLPRRPLSAYGISLPAPFCVSLASSHSATIFCRKILSITRHLTATVVSHSHAPFHTDWRGRGVEAPPTAPLSCAKPMKMVGYFGIMMRE